jgi:hypothetical protein
VHWADDLELFLLDQRSYRSRNDAPDGPGKTMLGRSAGAATPIPTQALTKRRK